MPMLDSINANIQTLITLPIVVVASNHHTKCMTNEQWDGFNAALQEWKQELCPNRYRPVNTTKKPL